MINNLFIQKIINQNPHFKIKCITEKSWILSGNFILNHTNKDVPFYEKFKVEIEIFKEYPLLLPKIKEVGGRVESKFQHINYDKSLCLAVESEMHEKLYPDYNFQDWMNYYVVPYFYSYCFYERYGIFPFGEKSHGCYGILEFYMIKFKLNSFKETLYFLKMMSQRRYSRMIKSQKYRGNILCPCGKKKTIDNCHKDVLISFLARGNIVRLKNDFNNIIQEINILASSEYKKKEKYEQV